MVNTMKQIIVDFFIIPSSFLSIDNKDVSVMMRDMDVNAIAGTLKLYFRELPEPLFTDDLYPNFAGGIGQLLFFKSKVVYLTTYTHIYFVV